MHASNWQRRHSECSTTESSLTYANKAHSSSALGRLEIPQASLDACERCQMSDCSANMAPTAGQQLQLWVPSKGRELCETVGKAQDTRSFCAPASCPASLESITLYFNCQDCPSINRRCINRKIFSSYTSCSDLLDVHACFCIPQALLPANSSWYCCNAKTLAPLVDM